LYICSYLFDEFFFCFFFTNIPFPYFTFLGLPTSLNLQSNYFPHYKIV
jgi:hypothetical protein